MKTHNVHKRMIAALLSISVVSGMGIPVFRQSAGLSIEASAADSQMNASKAVGINNTAEPEGFDEDDDQSNPYGRKTVSFGNASEVYARNMGADTGYIIGDNVSNVGAKYNGEITYWNTGYITESGAEVRTYISDIAVASDGSSMDKAVEPLKNKGYTIITYSNGDEIGEYADFNKGAGKGSAYIAVGYKTTSDPNNAIKDILVLCNETEKESFYYQGRTYSKAKALAGDGDLNDGAGGEYLYLVYTKDNNAASPNITACTGFDFYRGENATSNGIDGFEYDESKGTFTAYENVDLNWGAGKGTEYLYLCSNKETVRKLSVEGSQVTGKAKIQEKTAVNKTAGGNFDGNTEGKKNHYAMVAAVDNELQLAVVDAKKPGNSQTVRKLGTYSSSAKFEVSLAAQMSIVTGDFDGNGMDEIAVYNPYSAAGSCVEIYSKTGSGPIDDISSWEIKRTIGTTTDDVVTLSVGDINYDGIDDLVVGSAAGVSAYNGSRLNMFSDTMQICSGEAGSFSATVFRDSISGEYRNFIGVLKTRADHYYGDLSVFAYNGKDGFETVASVSGIPMQDVLKTLSSTEKLQVELVYANRVLYSPYFGQYGYKFEGGRLTKYTISNAPYARCISASTYYGTYYLPYDLQVTDVNGSGEQTIFRKAVKYFYNSDTKAKVLQSHSFSAETINSKSSRPLVMKAVQDTSRSVCYAILNTDSDTSYMTYTGKHWYSYTDPAVLAVLSSPPYFKDLLENDRLSGNYSGSTTSFGKTKGSGSSSSEAATISAGTYVSFEQDFAVFGVKVASVRSEIEVMAGFTAAYEQASEISYTTEYTTSSGADAVVFYSIPYEFYEYEMLYYDSNGAAHPNKQVIAIPKQPCTATVEMEKYKQISKMYSELPQLDDNVLQHTLGKPETYPNHTGNYQNVQEFDGNYMAVDFTSAGGGMAQSQSIEMSEEKGNTYSESTEVTISAGAGAGGVIVGAKAGIGAEASSTSISTNGCSFTAEIQNMPKEAEDYGYGMSWKLFSHDGTYTDSKGNTVKFPVVDYLVTDVIQPPLIPQNIHQNYADSTQNSIRLEWDYEDSSVAEQFNVYRISNINGRSAEVLVGSIFTGEGTVNTDGTYSYSFIDSGQSAGGKKITINPGTKYDYRVEASRGLTSPPPVSMPSETISAYSRSDAEYPEIVLRGVSGNALTVYPDRDYSITADVQNSGNFYQLLYQWQKKDNKNNWKDIKGANNQTLAITDTSSNDAGQYRCCIDAIYYNEERNEQSAVSVVTDEIDVTYKMRTVRMNSFAVSSSGNEPQAVLSLSPDNPYCFIAPSGKVNFTVRSTFYEKSYSVPLKISGKNAVAKLSDAADLSALPDGIYEVAAYYSGDNVFSSFAANSEEKILIGKSAVYPVLFNEKGERSDTFYYGDTMHVRFFSYSKDTDGNTTETELDNETNPAGFSVLLNKEPNIYSNNTITVKLKGIDAPQTFKYAYTVEKRPIEVRVIGSELFAGDVEGHLPQMDILSGTLADGDSLSELVRLTYMNSTKTTAVTITNDTAPGTYYAQLSAMNSNKANYYDIKLMSSAFTINTQRYALNLSAERFEGEQAGTISMTLPETRTGVTNGTFQYESGTKLKFSAEAANGYQFDRWLINGVAYTSETVTKNMPREQLNVQLYFKPYSGSVSVDEANLARVETPEGFENGKEYPVGTELTFTAINNDDSVFDHWVKVTGSKAVDVFTKSITLSVSNTPVMLYPIFAGAPREITLSEGIYAEYSYVNAENETVTGTLTSGAEVPNGAVLTLKALNADARIHYEWYINGEMQSANEETISCTVSENTSVELRTLTAQMDGHSLTLNGPITLNFYVDIKNYDHKALTAKISSAYYDNNQNKEVTAEIGTFEAQDGSPCKYNSGYDEYRFSVPLAAAMINNQITMEVYIEGCETPVLTDVYSVAEYANNKIATSSNQKLVHAMVSLLDYGTQAQKYFNYNNIEDKYANKDLTAEQIASARAGITEYAAALEQASAIDRTVVNNALTDNDIELTYTGCSLQLDSGVKLRYYFMPTNGTVEDALTVYGDAIHFTDSSVNAVTGIDGSEIFIETEQLPAALLTNANSYSLSIGDAVVIDNATINSYFKNISVKDNTNTRTAQLKIVNEALYYFAENSRVYFNK